MATTKWLKENYYGITKCQYEFLRTYIETGDKMKAMVAGEYSTSVENLDKNFEMVYNCTEKVDWAYKKMKKEKDKVEAELAEVEAELESMGISANDLGQDRIGILKEIDDAIKLEKRKRSGTGIGQLLKLKSDILNIKNSNPKILEITIVTEFDPNDQGGSIDY